MSEQEEIKMMMNRCSRDRKWMCSVECGKPIIVLSGLQVLIGCGFDPWSGHTRSLKKMEPITFLFIIQHPELEGGLDHPMTPVHCSL